MSNPIISAILCTHNRAPYLRKALDSLIQQSLPQDQYEILVVDNSSMDTNKQVIEEFAGAGPVHYLHESRPGLSHARNAGWRRALGRYVAYLDDDAIACPTWLEKILEVFENVTPTPSCVGGRTEAIWEAQRPTWVGDHFLQGVTIVDWSEVPHPLIGANFAFAREVLEKFGGFNNQSDSQGLRLFIGLPRSNDIQNLDALSQHLTEMSNEIKDRIRRLKAQTVQIPEVYSFNYHDMLASSVQEDNPPWALISPEDCDIPGMISGEERRYYQYIGQFYSGRGEVIELGPWLGCSTFYILKGLANNPNFTAKKLHVYDDFVWRAAWMNDKVGETERLANHQDFQFMFERYTASFQQHLRVEKRKIVNYDGNEDVPQLVWDGGPIEILYVDCGRTFEANEAWYRLFRSAFIPDRTLLIMQDWRLHREVPVRWYNQTKEFTDSKDGNLQLIHEVQDGGIATFFYRTAPSQSG